MEKKEVTKTTTEIVYIAEDGTEFNNQYRCIDYEREKEQEKLEKECFEKLGIKCEANYPSMISLKNEKEYKLFLIQNEDDLDLFIKTFKWWFSQLEGYWQVDKRTFKYPEVLCLVDFPRGEEEYRLYRISQLVYQFNSFMDELDYVINEKLSKDKET